VMIRLLKGGAQRMENQLLRALQCEKNIWRMFLKERPMIVLEKVSLLSFCCRGLFFLLVSWKRRVKGRRIM
jgi:hypothetical protein